MPPQKCFAKGSAFPELKKGRLRLYSMRFCPFAQRTRLVLAHKNIPYETVNVDLKEKPEWFLERNSVGLVPTLEQYDKVIYESLVTCDYLDDIYFNNRLTPTDPYRKARDAMLVNYFGNKFASNFFKVISSEGRDEETAEALRKALQRLEEEVTARGKFFGGEKVAMIDFMMWPWFERMSLLKTFAPAVVPSESVFPGLFSYIQAMLQDSAVKATMLDADTHLQYELSVKEGKPNYDLGLQL